MLEPEFSGVARDQYEGIARAYRHHVDAVLGMLCATDGRRPPSRSYAGLIERQIDIAHPVTGAFIARMVFRVDGARLRVLMFQPR